MNAALGLWALLSCATAPIIEAPACEVILASLDPTAGVPGDEITLIATPLTADYDTSIYVGGVRAGGIAVDRDGCEGCDACRSDNACTGCADCDACDLECETDCLEVARFALPALEPGPTTVQIFNGYGGSNALDIEILGASDTGDTGPDSGDTATDSGDSGADSGDTADSSDSGGDSSSDSGDSGDSGGDTAPDTGDTGASGVAAAPVELAWIPAEVGELVTPPL